MKPKTSIEPQLREQVAEATTAYSLSERPIAIVTSSPDPVLKRGSETGLEAHIRELAYRLYETRGRLDGYDLQDWLEVEAIVRQNGKLPA